MGWALIAHSSVPVCTPLSKALVLTQDGISLVTVFFDLGTHKLCRHGMHSFDLTCGLPRAVITRSPADMLHKARGGSRCALTPMVEGTSGFY